MINVILVDDHPVVSTGVAAILNSSDRYRFTAQVRSGEELLEIIGQTTCEVIVSDISMAGMSGLQLLKKIKTEFPGIKFVILTMHHELAFVKEAIEQDVDGYMLKEDPLELLLSLLDDVVKGYKTFSPKIQTFLIQKTAENSSPLDLLTVRERQVFDLVIDGMTHKEIADDLGISVSTVEFHKKNVKSKLNARNLADLLNVAYKHKR